MDELHCLEQQQAAQQDVASPEQDGAAQREAPSAAGSQTRCARSGRRVQQENCGQRASQGSQGASQLSPVVQPPRVAGAPRQPQHQPQQKQQQGRRGTKRRAPGDLPPAPEPEPEKADAAGWRTGVRGLSAPQQAQRPAPTRGPAAAAPVSPAATAFAAAAGPAAPPPPLASEFVPHRRVAAFVWSVVRRSMPAALLGDRRNRSRLRALLLRFVCQRRYEQMSVQLAAQGLRTSGYSWLAAPTEAGGVRRGVPPSQHAAQQRRLQLWLGWVLAVLVVPLLRSHFYCTESEAYRQRVFYYR